ncbi:MAG: hypothetical protein O3A00_24565 [Planctomycetota bacterium]|nr:hypothetical protein [Planctomycetota bacterium]
MTGSTHGSLSQEWSEQRRFSAAMLAVGLLVGFIGIYLMVVRPMKGRMDVVESRLLNVDREMDDLVGSQDDVWKTNNLLSSLKSQKLAVDGARDAIRTIRQFRAEIEAEAVKTEKAVSALEQIAMLQQSVIGQQEKTASAEVAFSGLVSLQQSLIESQARSAKAADAVVVLSKLHDDTVSASLKSDESRQQLARLVELQQASVAQAQATLNQLVEFKDRAAKRTENVAAADKSLDRLMAVKDRINVESASIDQAEAGLNGFVNLKNELIDESDDVAEVRNFTRQLLSLKDELALRGSNVAATRQKAQQLLDLNDEVAGAHQLDVAHNNLGELFGLQNKLISQTGRVADAVETLDVLADFQRQFDEHVASLDGMRRTMVDIIMMENSFKRAMVVLQPIVELSNLRHLSGAEVREAARSILNQRETRISSKSIKRTPLTDAIRPVSDQTASGVREKLVPTPIEPSLDAEKIETK